MPRVERERVEETRVVIGRRRHPARSGIRIAAAPGQWNRSLEAVVRNSCGRANIALSAIKRQSIQAIPWMQSRQDRCGGDSVSGNNVMPAWTRERLGRRVGNAGTEAGVWSPVVVVNHPRPQDEPKMPFIQHNQPIQTLASDRADQPFAERIRLRASYRRLQHGQTHRRHRVIDGGCIDAIVVVD
jgi:hypothetical protein